MKAQGQWSKVDIITIISTACNSFLIKTSEEQSLLATLLVQVAKPHEHMYSNRNMHTNNVKVRACGSSADS